MSRLFPIGNELDRLYDQLAQLQAQLEDSREPLRAIIQKRIRLKNSQIEDLEKAEYPANEDADNGPV